MRFPAPLRAGDLIGVTAPSTGVPATLRARLDVAIRTVETRGYEVVVGDCLDGTGTVSAPAAERAAELTAMLTDPSIRAVVPPWGGELAIDVLELLDWNAIAAAEPTWMVGFSDISTIITPLTVRTGTATIHGNNLLDTPYRPPGGLLSWLDIVTMAPGTTFTQTSPGRYRAVGFDDYREVPEVDEFTLDTAARWVRLDGTGDVDVTGRLIGGCVETLCNLTGTPFADLSGYELVYVEAAGHDAATIARNLHGMRLAGWFADARAVLVGRTRAPDTETLTQKEAVLDALGDLGVPIVADVECGHTQPFLPIVNGALGRLVCSATVNELTQTLA